MSSRRRRGGNRRDGAAGDAGDSRAEAEQSGVDHRPNRGLVLPTWMLLGAGMAFVFAILVLAVLQVFGPGLPRWNTGHRGDDVPPPGQVGVRDLWDLRDASIQGASPQLERFLLADDVDDAMWCSQGLHPTMSDKDVIGDLIARGSGVKPLTNTERQAVANILYEPSIVDRSLAAPLHKLQMNALLNADEAPDLALMAAVGLSSGRHRLLELGIDKLGDVRGALLDAAVGNPHAVYTRRAVHALLSPSEPVLMDKGDATDRLAVASLLDHASTYVARDAEAWLVHALAGKRDGGSRRAEAAGSEPPSDRAVAHDDADMPSDSDDDAEDDAEDDAGAKDASEENSGGGALDDDAVERTLSAIMDEALVSKASRVRVLKDLVDYLRNPRGSVLLLPSHPYIPNVAELRLLKHLHDDVPREVLDVQEGDPELTRGWSQLVWHAFAHGIGAMDPKTGEPQLGRTFEEADLDGDGALSLDEFVSSFQGLLMQPTQYATTRCPRTPP